MKHRTVSILLLLTLLLVSAVPLAAQQATTCEPGFRPFVDVRGEPVCVPNVPQRIVAIHDSNAGAQVLSLGVPLVGMATRDGRFNPGITRYFDLSDVIPVGEYYTPNVELILTLQPDLIVHEGYISGEQGTLYLEDGVLEALQAIAPVVAIDAFRPVEEVIADYEALLGDAVRVSAAEQQAELEQAIEELRALLGDDWRNVTASWLGYDGGNLRTIGAREVSITNILSEMGVQWSAIVQEADRPENGGYLSGISFERLELFNADLLIASLWDEAILSEPLYQALPVVQAEQAVELTGEVVRSMGGTHYVGYIDTARFLRQQVETLMPLRTDIVVEPLAAQQATPPASDAQVQVPGFPPFAPAPTMLEVVEDRGDTLVVRHLFGETEIPADPQRIYADGSTFDILLSLGIEPVAANTLYVDLIQPPSQLAPLIEGLTIYNRGPANPEVILSHQPDLILVWEVALWEGSEGVYELLSAIAPTVVLNENPYSYWEQATLDVAAMLGRTEQADELLEGYRAFVDAQCSLIRAALGGDSTVTLIGILPGQLYMLPPGYTTETGFAPISPTRWAYQDCQLTPGDEVLQVVGPDGDYALLSDELIPALQADHLVVLQLAGEEEDLRRLTESPLWQGLPAVQQGNVYVTPIPSNQSYYGALDTFEQFTALFAGEGEG